MRSFRIIGLTGLGLLRSVEIQAAELRLKELGSSGGAEMQKRS